MALAETNYTKITNPHRKCEWILNKISLKLEGCTNDLLVPVDMALGKEYVESFDHLLSIIMNSTDIDLVNANQGVTSTSNMFTMKVKNIKLDQGNQLVNLRKVLSLPELHVMRYVPREEFDIKGQEQEALPQPIDTIEDNNIIDYIE